MQDIEHIGQRIPPENFNGDDGIPAGRQRTSNRGYDADSTLGIEHQVSALSHGVFFEWKGQVVILLNI